MNRIKWGVYTLVLLFIACSLPKAGNNNDFFKHNANDIWIVAHRAITGENKYPENSLASIASCIEHGVDIIEIDVRESKDGELVIIHDKTLHRTTNGKGNVADLTLNELRQLRLLQNGKPSEERIPTLEEVLKLSKNKILIDLDIKLDTILFYKKIVNLVEKYEMSNQVIYFLYDKNDIRPLQAMAKKSIIMPRAYSLEDVNQLLNNYKDINIVHLDENSYSNNVMKKLISQKKRMWMNTLGEYDKMENTKESGFTTFFNMYPYVNVVQTDLAIQLKKYLATRDVK